MSDFVIDNSWDVEDELLVLWERELYNVLHVLRCFEDMRLGICNRTIELWYVVHKLQRSTIRVALKIFQPLEIRRDPRNRVLCDVLVLVFHKIFVLHDAILLLSPLPSFVLP
jgi:hypothetical protein